MSTVNNWLIKIVLELDTVTPSQIQRAEPRAVVAVGQIVVGVASEHLRRLWTLGLIYRDQYLKKYVQARRTEGGVEGLSEFLDEMAWRIEDDFYLLRQLLWRSMKEEFDGLHGKPFIGIAKGWQVIFSNKIGAEESLPPQNPIGFINFDTLRN